VHEKPKV
jgi:hypothetical protein